MRYLKQCLCAVVLTVSAQAAELYVDPAGSDTNPGTREAPLASLDGARLKVREQIQQGLDAPVTVLIRGGEYQLNETVVFSHKDSGTSEHPISYRAYPDETPVFSGAVPLKNWKKADAALPGVSADARGQLWYCDIPESHKGKWIITTLYNGQILLPRSRSGELKTSKAHVKDPLNEQPKSLSKLVKWDDDPVVFNRELHFEGDDLKDWKHPGDIEIFIVPGHKWLVNMLPLESVDVAKKIAVFAIDSTYSFNAGSSYFVENAIEYLDEPGEWVFDREKGRVYLWPTASIDSLDIRAPYLQEFIRVEGVEDGEPAKFLNFEGLTFQHGLRDTWQPDDLGLQHDWEMYDKGTAIMRFRHAENCSVQRSTFRASSGAGVRLDLYAQRIQVSDNHFHHLGGTGILLSGYGPGTKDENKFNVVHNNYLHHLGEIYKHSPAIFVAQSGHNEITHNTIHDLAYNGIVISGCRPHELMMTKVLKNRREWVGTIRKDEIGPYIKDITSEMLVDWINFDVSMIEPLLHARENRIAYNDIYHVMLELHDGNGIYFSGMGKNNRAEFNYIHDLDGTQGFIRLDDISSFTIIANNVGYRGDRMFQIKGPCKLSNNFVIDTASFCPRTYYSFESDKNVYYYSKPEGGEHKPTTRGRGVIIPGAKSTYEAMKCCSNSLVFDVKSIPNFEPGDDLIPEEKRAGAEVGMLYADPMFDEEAMKQKIFRFKPGSPAIKLGIQPIDLSNVGSTLAR